MNAAAERRRSIDVVDVVAHIKEKLTTWGVSDEDVLWAIRKGARQSNKKASKSLMAAAQYGGSRLVPYDDDWVVKGNDVILDALNIIEAELIAKSDAEFAAEWAAGSTVTKLGAAQ
jgi:hypothetical protein